MNSFLSATNRVLKIGVLAAFILTMSGRVAVFAEEAAAPETDPTTGMIIDDDWMLVMATCSVCHSPKLFTEYGATRETWSSLITWMQKTQGLWQFDPVTKDKILTYLAKNYPPGEASRRRNLPASMRPINPYVSAAKAEYEAKLKQGKIVAPQ